MTNLKLKSIGEGQVILGARSISNWISNLTSLERWHSRGYSTWDNLYKYCWWDIKVNNAVIPTRRVTSPEELVHSIAVPHLTDSGGGMYEGGIAFKLSLQVDEDDLFPQLRICRNSLVASARGRHKYNRHSLPQSGISGSFNAPNYYLNYWGQTGQLFVQHHTSTLPASNNDGIVWWPLNSNTKDSWPKIGNVIDLQAPTRTACWDTVGLNYVSPAPAGYWVIGQPFLWTEFEKNRLLTAVAITGPDEDNTALQGPTALVFPVTFGNYVAFLVHAHSFDSFITDFVNSNEELVMKVKYKHNKHAFYTTLTSQSQDYDSRGNRKSLFNFFNGGNYPLYKLPSTSTIDANTTLTSIQICKRNINTAIHSPWVTLATMKRRIPNAPLRLDPAFRRQQ